jgi:hypothetical protein
VVVVPVVEVVVVVVMVMVMVVVVVAVAAESAVGQHPFRPAYAMVLACVPRAADEEVCAW